MDAPPEPPAKRQRTSAPGAPSRSTTPQAQPPPQQPAQSAAEDLTNVRAVFNKIVASGDRVQLDQAMDFLLSTKPGVVADMIISNLVYLPAQRPPDDAPGQRSGMAVLAELLSSKRQPKGPSPAPQAQQQQEAKPEAAAAAARQGTPPAAPAATAAAAKPGPGAAGAAAAAAGAAAPGAASAPAAVPARPVKKGPSLWPPPLQPSEARVLRLAAVKRILANRHVAAPNFRELLLARLATKVRR